MIELLVVISIITFLIAMLMPVLAQARRAAMGSQCQSNLRQLQLASLAYTNDSNDVIIPAYVMPGYWWLNSGGVAFGINRYLEGAPAKPPAALCPECPYTYQVPTRPTTYGINDNISRQAVPLSPVFRLVQIPRPTLVIGIADAGRNGTNNYVMDVTGRVAYAGYWHLDDRCNVVMLDGHTNKVKASDSLGGGSPVNHYEKMNLSYYRFY